MVDFKFDCPHCQQSLEAPEDMLGMSIDPKIPPNNNTTTALPVYS